MEIKELNSKRGCGISTEQKLEHLHFKVNGCDCIMLIMDIGWLLYVLNHFFILFS